MDLLLEHFEIPLDDEHPWPRLVLKLAIRHVPAFQLSSEDELPPGRPEVWGGKELFYLQCRVEDELTTGASISEACRRLYARRQQRR